MINTESPVTNITDISEQENLKCMAPIVFYSDTLLKIIMYRMLTAKLVSRACNFNAHAAELHISSLSCVQSSLLGGDFFHLHSTELQMRA